LEKIDLKNPRLEIAKAIDTGNLKYLLTLTGLLHGHYCPGSASGVKAGARAMRDLRIERSTGMEDVIAFVETNSCFGDGIQIVTGCSFGNNALIYRDLGKTAFTLARRNGEGIRIVSKRSEGRGQESEASRQFRQLVNERKTNEANTAKVLQLQIEAAFKLLEIPDEELFDIRRVKIDLPDYSRLYASAKCSVCGESMMEPRARIKDGKPICLTCAGEAYFQLAGDGISAIRAASRDLSCG
jgi:formylmethanofuran dehydrogenase subunit E